MKYSKVLLLIYVVLNLKSTPNFSQNNPLAIFNDLIDKEWIGHYHNSEDSNLVHILIWHYDLDKKIVKAIKTVPELKFKMETTFYYDFENNKISFISFVNKDMLGKGVAILEQGKILLTGKTFFNSGHSDFKTTYEINKNGELIDHFYRKKNDTWSLGHLIKYKIH